MNKWKKFQKYHRFCGIYTLSTKERNKKWIFRLYRIRAGVSFRPKKQRPTVLSTDTSKALALGREAVLICGHRWLPGGLCLEAI